MELEAWHLLVIPLFFVLGWLAARVDIRHVMHESRAVPRSYFKGLNYLLSDQPDKAIEAFLEVAKMDPDTLELHFALGALFRRRGEVDRAIRIHQNLLDRADLNQDARTKASYELGQDFLKAGLLDRAENVFHRLETGVYARDVLRHLLDIQVLTKEWGPAIQTAQRLEKMGCPALSADVAHYYCELALVAQLKGDKAAAFGHLEAAIAQHPRSARAWILRGDLEAQSGDDEAAIGSWSRIEAVNPAFLPLVAERLLQAHERQGKAQEGEALLQAYLERHPSKDLLHLIFQNVAAHQGWQAARELAARELRRTPSLRALDDYLQAGIALMETDAPERLESQLAQNLVQQQVAREASYVCHQCGFKARQFFWQCPACARWETIAPERGA
ncbi:MAG: lipopolysaccharide assembly protein LapB [Pseudomonadota bacterium]